MADDDISWDETAKRLKNIGGATASGAMAGGVPGALVGAGMAVAMPALSKIFGSAFGGSEAQHARDQAIGDLNRVATGGTTQGQAGAAYQRGTTLQGLEAMAAKGTATQRAGLQRQAMLQAPEIQARQGAQLADLRAKEQEHARSTAAYLSQQAAQQDLVSARKSAAGAIGGLAQAGTQLFMGAQGGSPSAADDDAFKETLNLGELGTSNDSTGDKSAEYAKALGFTPGAAAPAAGPNLAGIDPAVVASLKTGTPGYEDVEQADPNTQYQHFPGAFGGSIRNRPVGVTGSEQATVNAAAGAQDAQNLATFNQLSAAGPGRGFTSDIGGSTARMDANADRMRRSLTAQVGDKPASPASLSQAVALSQPAPSQPARDLSAGASGDPMRGIAYSTDPSAPENLASAVPNTGRRPRAVRGSR